MTNAGGWAPAALAVVAPRFTAERVAGYGGVTNDMNPIHVDPVFAARSRFGRPIVHGMFVLAPVWNALAAAFGQSAATGSEASIRFVAPVSVGATPVYVILCEHADAHTATYRIDIRDEAGVQAVTGSIVVAKPAA